jgi:site-specific DNA-methyltransferase (adenine-specific)
VTAPYYQDDLVTLYKADALSVLTTLESNSVDALVTDPPYSSGGMTRADRMQSTTEKYVQSDSANRDRLTEFTGDNRDQRSYAYWCALWLGEALRVVRPGGVALLFTDWRQLPATTDALQAGGWVWRGIVPWYKPSARPQAGRFTAQCEYVVWGSKGAMPVDYTPGVKTLPGFYQASPPRDRDHQTQKPMDVMRKLVRIADEGGTILDPFAGSGTTLLAAKEEGYRAIGSEMVEAHCETAAKRLAQETLFGGGA